MRTPLRSLLLALPAACGLACDEPVLLPAPDVGAGAGDGAGPAATCPDGLASAAAWRMPLGGAAARSSQAAVRGPSAPTVAWTATDAATWWETPVVADGLVVAARIVELGAPALDDVVAFDEVTGAVRWRATVPVVDDDWHVHILALAPGVVYATRAGNAGAAPVFALSAEDGRVLWRSESEIAAEYVEGAVLLDDGDLVAADAWHAQAMVRIDALDGATVWSAPYTCTSSGACGLVVSKGRVYAFAYQDASDVVVAWDVETGARRYEGTQMPWGGLATSRLPFTDGAGKVYAPFGERDLVSLDDDGEGLEERWRAVIAPAPFSTSALRPDANLVTIAEDGALVALDPDTGVERARSTIQFPDAAEDFVAASMTNIVVDETGVVFVNRPRVAAFDAELAPLWSDTGGEATFGLALGGCGSLVAAGATLRVFRAGPPADTAR